MHLSVVSPVYKAEGCLRELVARVDRAVAPIVPSFEIVLVDDGSPDGSWRVLEELARENPRVRAIQLSRNFGQHHAITAGIEASRGDWIVVMDCDLQDRPEEIPRLYAKAKEGHDVVLARRIGRKDPLFKRSSSWLFWRLFNWLTDLRYDGSVANFSIISRRVAEEVKRMREAVRFYGGFLSWIGFSPAFIDVQHDPRFEGRSSYSFFKLLRLSSNVILAHSNRPLRYCVALGISLSMLSIAAGLVWLVRVLIYGSPVMGWPSLIISIYFSTGAIIFTLGVLGLYIDRIFSEVKRRPLFVVRRTSFDA